MISLAASSCLDSTQAWNFVVVLFLNIDLLGLVRNYLDDIAMICLPSYNGSPHFPLEGSLLLARTRLPHQRHMQIPKGCVYWCSTTRLYKMWSTVHHCHMSRRRSFSFFIAYITINPSKSMSSFS